MRYAGSSPCAVGCATGAAAGAAAQSRSMTGVVVPGRGDDGARRMAAGAASPSTAATRPGGVSGSIGRNTASAASAARMPRRYSVDRPAQTATTSPGPTPAARNCPASHDAVVSSRA